MKTKQYAYAEEYIMCPILDLCIIFHNNVPMATPLTMEDVDPNIRSKVYTQAYEPKKTIEGVQIVTLKSMSGEDSDFTELMRGNAQGESENFPGFHVAQINRSTQIPGSIKAWHLHLAQDEVWYVTDEGRLLTGLWDVRKGSPTFGVTMRVPMGASTHKMVYIPRGVAHGSINLTNVTSTILYFMNGQFNKEKPDEHRISWDAQGADFWQVQRD